MACDQDNVLSSGNELYVTKISASVFCVTQMYTCNQS